MGESPIKVLLPDRPDQALILRALLDDSPLAYLNSALYDIRLEYSRRMPPRRTGRTWAAQYEINSPGPSPSSPACARNHRARDLPILRAGRATSRAPRHVHLQLSVTGEGWPKVSTYQRARFSKLISPAHRPLFTTSIHDFSREGQQWQVRPEPPCRRGFSFLEVYMCAVMFVRNFQR